MVFGGAKDGKEPLWFGSFFAYRDVGKGREQERKLFAKINELAAAKLHLKLQTLILKKIS